jgi:small-conductance mechanosensitive channel
LQFLSRPFVAGDSITVQSTRHVIVSGTVERITPLRTLMRTDDDVLVTVPNKVGAFFSCLHMIILYD